MDFMVPTSFLGKVLPEPPDFPFASEKLCYVCQKQKPVILESLLITITYQSSFPMIGSSQHLSMGSFFTLLEYTLELPPFVQDSKSKHPPLCPWNPGQEHSTPWLPVLRLPFSTSSPGSVLQASTERKALLCDSGDAPASRQAAHTHIPGPAHLQCPAEGQRPYQLGR